MTTLETIADECRICGTLSEHNAIASTHASGPADLDTRPPEAVRSCIAYGIRRCPSCGYCAPTLSKGPEEAADILKSDKYRDQLHSDAYPEIANRFLCWAIIQEEVGEFATAGWSAVRAAWVCDDEGASEAADLCRLQAVRLFGRASQAGVVFAGGRGADEALLADLLRRAGHFDEIDKLVESGLQRKPDMHLSRVLRLQKELADRGDRDRHTVDEASP